MAYNSRQQQQQQQPSYEDNGYYYPSENDGYYNAPAQHGQQQQQPGYVDAGAAASPEQSYGYGNDDRYAPAWGTYDASGTTGAHNYPPTSTANKLTRPGSRTQNDSASDVYSKEGAGALAYGQDEYAAASAPQRGSLAAKMAAEGVFPKKEGLRVFRAEEHKGAFTRGGGARACGRCCCCTLILAILTVICVISSFLLWVRPPNVSFEGIELPTGSDAYSLSSNGFEINFNITIDVQNPNFFGASFESIKAKAFYDAAPDTQIGGGNLTDVSIPEHSTTTIHFPFTVTYSLAEDTNLAILKSIAQDCGFASTGTQQDLKFDYTVTLGLKVATVVISPSFSSSTSFACPLSQSDIESILGSSDLSSIGDLLGSGSSSRLSKRGGLMGSEGIARAEQLAKRVLVERAAAITARRHVVLLGDGGGAWLE